MELKDYLTIFVPTTVTLVGFIINFILNRRLNLELVKQNLEMKILKTKSDKQIEDLYGLQKNIFDFIDLLYDLISREEISIELFETKKEEIEKSIICVGSEDAVKLIIYIRETIYSYIEKKYVEYAKQKIDPSSCQSDYEKQLEEYTTSKKKRIDLFMYREDPCFILSPYVLLAMQVKYDTTGILTSPEAWFTGRSTSWLFLCRNRGENQEERFYINSAYEVNRIVDKLGLNQKFKMSTKI